MTALFKRFFAFQLIFVISLGAPILTIAQAPTSPASPPSPSAPATLPSATNAAPPPANNPWPHVLTYQGATISVYQPQVESWQGNQLSARAAVRIESPNKQATDYGVIWVTARTEVDKVNRMVTLTDMKLTKQSFPTVANNGDAYTAAIVKNTPAIRTTTAMSISTTPPRDGSSTPAAGGTVLPPVSTARPPTAGRQRVARGLTAGATSTPADGVAASVEEAGPIERVVEAGAVCVAASGGSAQSD